MDPRRLLLLTLAAWLLAMPVAWAHGGGTPRLVNEPLGPYWLSVWTQPDPPQVGELHVTAALARTDTGEPVTEPVITVYARSPHGDEIQAPMAHEDAAIPYFYDTDFQIPYAGTWTIELQVQEAGWESRASFPLEIQPAPINKTYIRLTAFATLVVLFTGWWFWGRKPRAKRPRKRIFMSHPDES